MDTPIDTTRNNALVGVLRGLVANVASPMKATTLVKYAREMSDGPSGYTQVKHVYALAVSENRASEYKGYSADDKPSDVFFDPLTAYKLVDFTYIYNETGNASYANAILKHIRQNRDDTMDSALLQYRGAAFLEKPDFDFIDMLRLRAGLSPGKNEEYYTDCTQLLMTEYRAGSVSLRSYLSDIRRKPFDVHTPQERIDSILFQVAFCLMKIADMNITHNDCHLQNFLVVTRPAHRHRKVEVFRDKKEDRTGWKFEAVDTVSLFDWDLAYSPDVGYNVDIHEFSYLGLAVHRTIAPKVDVWHAYHEILSHLDHSAAWRPEDTSIVRARDFVRDVIGIDRDKLPPHIVTTDGDHYIVKKVVGDPVGLCAFQPGPDDPCSVLHPRAIINSDYFAQYKCEM